MSYTVLNVATEPNRSVRTCILRGAGFNVVESDLCADALRLAGDNRAEVILLHPGVSAANAFELCARIKADPVTATSQVLYVAEADVWNPNPSQVTGFESGADAYLVEPVSPGRLLANVFAAIRRWHQEGELRAALDERKRAEQELRGRIEELKTVMDVAPVAICVANDPECRDITGNSTANAFYQARPGENVSATTVGDVRRFFRDGVELRPEQLPMQEAVGLNIDIRNAELEVLLPSGRRMHMLGNASPLRDVSDEVRGGVAAFLDVSERKRIETEIRKRTEELAGLNEDLRHFAYAASHDLQEPLRMIASYSQLLARKHQAGDSDTEQFVSVILDSVTRMRLLIDDLLKYCRVVQEGSSAARRVDLRDVVAEALFNLQAAIQESGARIDSGGLPSLIIDEPEMVQVFQNLISNALKYRDAKRPPEVRLSAASSGDGWIICVEDNGIGFDIKYADHIFGIFKRLHRNDYPGTGIGLAICKRIVERQGGRMWAESEEGKGSKFYFTIPATVGEVESLTIA